MISLLRTLTEQPSIGTIAFASNGTKFATGGSYRDTSIRVWDRGRLEPVQRLRGHKKRITSLAFADDGGTLASSSGDRTVALWDLVRAERVASHVVHRKIVNRVACHGAAPSLVASGGQDGVLCLWEPRSESGPRSIDAHRGSVNALAISPRGDMIVTGGGMERSKFSLQVWDIEAGRAIHTLGGHDDWPLWAGFSPDGDRLASGSYGEICLWDTRSWRLSRLLRGPDPARFSMLAFSFTSEPDRLVSGGWGHDEHRVEIRDASGKLAGWNVRHPGVVQLWELDTGTLRDSVAAHDDALTCLATSPIEPLLVTAGKDGGAKVWTLASD